MHSSSHVCWFICLFLLVDNQPVYVDGRRATADPQQGTITYNFYTRPPKSLTSATWFVQQQDNNNNNNNKDPILKQLTPMSDKDATAVEALYQQAIYAASSLGSGMESVLHQKKEVILEDTPDYRARIVLSSDGHYVIQKSLTGWFGKSYDLQRGFGAYVIEGEEDELALGPVTHVCFVVHGIGEAMWSREDVQISGLVDTITNARLAMNKKKREEWKKQCEQAKKEKYVCMYVCQRGRASDSQCSAVQWILLSHMSSDQLTN
jgi:hypothetical protein